MSTATPTGSGSTILVIIRGNSGSGKSTVAAAVRGRYGRGCALIQQDHLRRILLREHDKPGAIAPDLIEHTARFCLDHHYHVIIEGIMAAARYRDMLHRLHTAHQGTTTSYYLDVPLEETLRRHTQRTQANEFTAEQMRSWYLPDDRLHLDAEIVIPHTCSIEDAVHLISMRSGLLRAAHHNTRARAPTGNGTDPSQDSPEGDHRQGPQQQERPERHGVAPA